MQVIAYTDGSALGNPGPGGYGIVLRSGQHYKELAGGFRLTTNNRMELLAVCVALEALKQPGTEIEICTDSQYVQKAVSQGWVFGWEKKGFEGKANPDLWRRFLQVYRRHRVKFRWIRGHSGIPDNERCDVLAKAAAQMPGLPPDAGYVPAPRTA